MTKSRPTEYSPVTGRFYREGTRVGTTTADGYIVVWEHGRLYLAHRLAWFKMTGEWPDQVDHRNGHRADNRWLNLRDVTNQGNQEARHTAVAASGLIGVYRRKDTGKFTSKIKHNGASINLGCFASAEEARHAYLAKKRELHGTLPG